ncbi:CREB/ATF bZIP transcription factor [Centropristis striata]|uniref:CREB/ATF bZIP transcription factor n=1 Tax=Centropristis striata TaxID=184440 RepID=UPI0027DFD834|nr:CREB/ATF bZIP transcription factor [Centropristis striata]XP_059190150.1 CREB/ATF bZIP transcription factor [Centropristis striata]
MITRRRVHALINTESQPMEGEEINVVESVKDLPNPSGGFSPDDLDTTGMELDDLFGIEDLKLTLERDSVSSLFDIELADLGVFRSKDPDSDIEASTASSPERIASDVKMKNRRKQSTDNMINKNAIAARLNRLRKKEYVNSLEKKVDVLSTENSSLKQENVQLNKRVEELEDETRAATPPTTTTPCPGSV